MDCWRNAGRGKRTASRSPTRKETTTDTAQHQQGGAMSTTTGEGTSRHALAERITVALITKAAEDLTRTQARTGLSKTDIVNRALTLYEFLDARLASGYEILVRHKDTGDVELLRLL
jgi:hypothetical protein